MIAHIRFEGANLRFEKTVTLATLPDVGDLVRVKPVGEWVALFGDGPVGGYVKSRSFVERDWTSPAEMSIVIDVQQA